MDTEVADAELLTSLFPAFVTWRALKKNCTLENKGHNQPAKDTWTAFLV